MSAKKMLVVSLAKTNAVVGVATRRTAGAPPIEDLVGSALLTRIAGLESGVPVPVEELSVKETDYSEDVVRQPLAHVMDASGIPIVPSGTVSAIGTPGVTIQVTVSSAPPADKAVLVVIEAGPNREPLRFVAKTTLNAANTDVPIAGVPPGDHVVLASVDGFGTRLESKLFS